MFDFEIHSNVKYRIDKARNEVIVVEYEDTPLSSHVTIKESIRGIPVREIGMQAFLRADNLISIKLPDSISTVSSKAFYDCIGLTHVLFYKSKNPSAAVYFGQFAVASCPNLELVDFTESKKINCGLNAFSHCHALRAITGMLECLDSEVFANCFELDNVIFADGAYWKTNTFSGCSKLKHFTFLGDISPITPTTSIKKLRGKYIKCSPDSKVVELSYEGVHMTIMEV